MCLAWGPHLKDRAPSARDPLRLALLPPDSWSIAGILSGLALLLFVQDVGFLVCLPALANFLVTAEFPLRNIRYSYPLFPLFLISTFILLAALSHAYKSRSGRRAPDLRTSGQNDAARFHD
jgi:uncharacterized membrane protein